MAIDNFIPTIWSESLHHELDKTYVGVANCNREFEGEILEKGNKVRICGVSPVTVGNYTKNSDISEPATLTDFYTDLEIDRAKYFNFQIDDVDRAQTNPKVMEAALKGAADALATEAERYVYSLAADAQHSIVNSKPTSGNILSTLIDARTMLSREGVTDPSDIVMEVSPEIAGLILKAKMETASDNTSALENGYIGCIGGCKIYMSPSISTFEEDGSVYANCLVRSRRAIAFAEQLSEIEAYRPEHRFADAMKGLHLYGAKTVYPNEMVAVSLCVSHLIS